MRRLAGLFTLAFLLAVPAAAHAADPDGPGPWADVVVSVHQGAQADGGVIDERRSVANAALGVAENRKDPDRWPEYFLSLGFGGDVTLGFDNPICADGTGYALGIAESTTPPYGAELADVFLSEDGVNFVQAAASAPAGRVALPPGMALAKYVRIVDRTPREKFSGDADGYDVDGVRALSTDCARPQPVTGGGSGATPVADGGVLGATTGNRCTPRKRLKVKVNIPKGFKVERARVFVKGKKLKKKRYTLKGLHRRKATLTIRKVPKGRFQVKVTLINSEGKKIVGKRRYYACGTKAKPINGKRS